MRSGGQSFQAALILCNMWFTPEEQQHMENGLAVFLFCILNAIGMWYNLNRLINLCEQHVQGCPPQSTPKKVKARAKNVKQSLKSVSEIYQDKPVFSLNSREIFQQALSIIIGLAYEKIIIPGENQPK